MRVRAMWIVLGLLAPIPAVTAQQSNPELIGQLVAFHGSKAIVSVMTTHCYETTGLDTAYQTAADNWYLRNVGYLDLADRVIARLGGAADGQIAATETHGGEEIMTAYNTAADKDVFCKDFLGRLDSGGFDLNKLLPEVLAQAQAIAAQ